MSESRSLSIEVHWCTVSNSGKKIYILFYAQVQLKMEEIEGFDQYENYLDSLVGEEDTKSVNLSSIICKIN